MKFETGFTPSVSGASSPYGTDKQGMLDGLKEKIDEEQARLDERSENFHNTLLPLCDSMQESSSIALNKYRQASAKEKDIFTQYQTYQKNLAELQAQQRQKKEAAMSKYSGVGMVSQRDKAGATASSQFDEQIQQAQELANTSFESYGLQSAQTELANQDKTTARFDLTSAYNNAISEGFSLASAEMDLGKMKQQYSFFEGMA